MNDYNKSSLKPDSPATQGLIASLYLESNGVPASINSIIRQGASSGSSVSCTYNLLDINKISNYNILVDDISLAFNALAERWKDETKYLSSINDIAMNSAYLKIIGMGQIAIPLILSEMEKEYSHWFLALESITGENPVSTEQMGRIKEMTEAWLQWGRESGYIT